MARIGGEPLNAQFHVFARKLCWPSKMPGRIVILAALALHAPLVLAFTGVPPPSAARHAFASGASAHRTRLAGPAATQRPRRGRVVQPLRRDAQAYPSMALESAAPMPMDISLAVLGDAGPQSFSTQELFGGKRSVIVGVAGAFEPKSTKELEVLMGKLLDLRANGAELVACVSVNDPWVVKAWAKSEGVGSGNSTVQMLADGDGSFTRALGFMADEDVLLGARSKSYAIVLDEKGTCEYMVLESEDMADKVSKPGC